MDKQKLIQNIDEAILKEETALPIYAEHMNNAIFWAKLSSEKQKKVIAALKILLEDSTRHAQTLKKVKTLI